MEGKKVPDLNFAIRLILNFPISEKRKISEEFKLACANKGTDKSKQLRLFLYEEMGIDINQPQYKIDEELRKKLKKPIKEAREEIRKIVEKEGDKNFSQIMSEKIRNYLGVSK